MKTEQTEKRESEPKFEIREAAVADAAVITKIQYDSWLTTYPSEEFGITKEDLIKKMGDLGLRAKRWAGILEEVEANKDKMRVFVIIEGEKRVGFCKVNKQDNEGHIDALYLDPEFKGKGAGSTVFQSSLSWLGDTKPVTLEVAAYNARDIDFYKRFGFHEDGMDEPYAVGPDQFMPLLKMRRDGKTE